MSITLPTHIFNINGQVVKDFISDDSKHSLKFICDRDKRYKAKTDYPGNFTTNRYVRRDVKDLPLWGRMVVLSIELKQLRFPDGTRRIESVDFVDKSCYYTLRFCKLVSGLCRYMPMSTVAKHLKLRWETVKNMDKHYLETTLPNMEPGELRNLRYIGVDEVAKAKGHNYMTVVYNMESGKLIWVHEGRKAEVLSLFLNALPESTKCGILAVAMDMGLAYQKAVKQCLPNADIVFDRFHVMQNFSKAMQNQRRVEFRRANEPSKKLLKGSRYLLLRNQENLSEKQKVKLTKLLSENTNINAMYLLKEQLQLLWQCQTFEGMAAAVDDWCRLAEESGLLYIKKFAASLQSHKTGICNYAKHPLTTARIEAGNVAIGMIRKRARGLRDVEYLKLKIRQLSTKPDELFIDTDRI